MAIQLGGVTLDTRVLDRITKELEDNADEAVSEIAHEAEGDIKQLIVQKNIVDKGFFLNSIKTRKKEKMLYEVSDGVEYGVYQELGTSKMQARPTFQPAMEIANRNIAKKFEKLFK